MHDSLERQLFHQIATSHVISGGIIRVVKLEEYWSAGLSKGDEKFKGIVTVSRNGEDPTGSLYVGASQAVDAFIQRFRVLGLWRDDGRSPTAWPSNPLNDVQFLFDNHHPNVAVTWRHLKARFKGIQLILQQDRRVMEQIIEEAASM